MRQLSSVSAKIACFFAVSTATVLLTVDFSKAGDWPQILGPSRNGVAKGEKLGEWPESGPRVLWKQKLGQGYAGAAVEGKFVVAFHRVGDKDRVEAFDAGTGETLWKTDFDAVYRGGINPDVGPRCVPLIHKQRVFLYSADGSLYCVALADGKVQWKKTVLADLDGDEGYFGAGSTPIAIDDELLVNVGGDEAGLAAFDTATGRMLWKKTDERASYAAPTTATIDGRTYAVFVTRLNCVAVDPATGIERFRFPFGQRGPTVNAATPLVFDNLLFVTASYGIGAAVKQIDGVKLKSIWANDNSMSSQYATPIYHQGRLYGCDGREDVGEASYRCVEAKTGRVVWSVDGFGVAHTILVGDKLLLQKIDGEVLIAKATPEKFELLDQADIVDETTRALPALAGGKLYLRTSGGSGGELICVEVGE